MITSQQAAEIRRLASLWATARVRKALAQSGNGGPGETSLSTQNRADQAEQELTDYLKTLMEPA